MHPCRLNFRCVPDDILPFSVVAEASSLEYRGRAIVDPEDARRLRREEIREALTETHEALLARPGNRVIIAEHGEGERVGMLWFGMNRNLITGEQEAWIYNLSVIDAYQGRGIGRRLLEHAEGLAREAGCPVLGLMVSSHNQRARQIYEAFGFRTTNVLMRKRVPPPP